MNDADDPRLGALLRTLRPPARDPLFRIGILERRERRQFRGRVALLLGAGVVAGVAYAFATLAGGTTDVARGAGLAVAVVAAASMYVPALMGAFRAMSR